MHAITISGDVHRDVSTSSTNDDGGINNLNVFSVNDHITDKFFEEDDKDIKQQ